MADYQQLETRESSTGAKLLTANRRVVLPVFQTNSIAVGFNSIGIPLPSPQPTFGNPFTWPLPANRRYKFGCSCNLVTSKAGSAVISLESASLQFGWDATQPPSYGSAARLSSLTALAQGNLFNVDDYLIDANDMRAAFNAYMAAAGLAGAQPALSVTLVVNLNNAGAGAHDMTFQVYFNYDIADFNSYRFSKWE